ncbi:MAG: hypothetical protein WCG55_04000 [bacterium]
MESQNCQNCKMAFTIDSEDLSFYEKIQVPQPTFCYLCRAQRRMSFRNERKLFRVKDAFTGKEIFSLYPPEANCKVITSEEWYGDSWDGTEYGHDYDFSRPFLEQLFELDKKVPVLNLNVALMQRSDYCANADNLKDCYLVFASQFTENSLYCTSTNESKDCMDTSLITGGERCYECFWIQNCSQCYFTIMSVESRNLWFCRDCKGCSDCFGCTNLRQSSYCIFNKQYTKEEYKKEIEKLRLDTRTGIKEAHMKTRAFWDTQIVKYQQGLRNLNTTGSYVTDSKNIHDSFLIREGENLRYCQNMEIPGNKDCMDVYEWGEKTELCYETSGVGTNAYNVQFSYDCWPSVSSCQYSMHLRGCSDCFGCVGLKKKQYCIFNKQYSKEEYEALVPKIIEQMNTLPYVDAKGRIYKYGEFFPIELSPYGYNNTVAADFFPITDAEAKVQAYPWIEVERNTYAITKKQSDLADSIHEVDDSILKKIIECEQCAKPYRILQNELSLLRRESLPLPTLCIECRHARRISDRLKINLYERICMCGGLNDTTMTYKNTRTHIHGGNFCGEKFKTGYSSDRLEIVYCEQCYQNEVA